MVRYWYAVCLTQVRDEEMEELEQMLCNFCELPAAGGVENGYGKINILLQTYIGRGEVDSFSLISDLSYVAQVKNGTKITAFTHCLHFKRFCGIITVELCPLSLLGGWLETVSVETLYHCYMWLHNNSFHVVRSVLSKIAGRNSHFALNSASLDEQLVPAVGVISVSNVCWF